MIVGKSGMGGTLPVLTNLFVDLASRLPFRRSSTARSSSLSISMVPARACSTSLTRLDSRSAALSIAMRAVRSLAVHDVVPEAGDKGDFGEPLVERDAFVTGGDNE